MAKLTFPQRPDNLSDDWVKHHADVHRKINKAASVATVTTADASDPASVITLANALKVAFNNLITAFNT